MSSGNSYFDLAELRSEQEREAAVAAASRAIMATGTIQCIDCENEISIERRQALKSASRCIHCQKLFEESSSRRPA